MADPISVADAYGEFLEIGNPGDDTLLLDTLRIKADLQSLSLTHIALAPGELFLVCRDSLGSRNGGMVCDKQWSSLSLANGRSVLVALSWGSSKKEYALPVSKPGVSWENTWESTEGFQKFLPSNAAGAGGDSASPGIRNNQSMRVPETDLGIKEIIWKQNENLQIRVVSEGKTLPSFVTLSLKLDSDWDGEPEMVLDSLSVPFPNTGEARIGFAVGEGVRGVVHAHLGRDEVAANNHFRLPLETGTILAITEWQPAPPPGEAEWIEIRNGTPDGSGLSRRLDLAQASLNGFSLGPTAGYLEPGDFIVLTENVDLFRARYGEIKSRVLQPVGWPPLRNSNDTLVLSLAGITVDSLEYDAKNRPVGRTFSEIHKSELTAPGAEGTPGYYGEIVSEIGWTISSRVTGVGRPLEVSVKAPPGQTYQLMVFDLEGNRVRDLRSGKEGTTVHAWEGRGEGGRLLNPGPYILCLTRNGQRPLRQVVLVRAWR